MTAGNLTLNLISVLHHASILQAMEPGSGRTPWPETLQPVVSRLCQSLLALPGGMMPEKIRHQLVRELRGAETRPSTIGFLLDTVTSLFPDKSWYVPPPSRRSPLWRSGGQQGMEVLFRPTPIPHLIPFDIVSEEGIVEPQLSDPPTVGFKAYRLAEVTALAYLLGPQSPHRLIFVPGFVGTGKKSEILPPVVNILRGHDVLPEYLDLSDTRTGAGEIRRLIRAGKSISILIVDEVSQFFVTNPRKLGELQQQLSRFLRGNPATKVVLVGGGGSSTGAQATLLRYDFRGLVAEEETATVAIEPKPLNPLQSKEFLTGENSVLNEAAKDTYVRFVLERVPPYLIPLRVFKLPMMILNLQQALSFFQASFKDLPTTLLRAHIAPREALDQIGDRLERDIGRLLTQHRQT